MPADPQSSSTHDPVRVIGLCLKHGSPQVDEGVRTLAKWLAERDVGRLIGLDIQGANAERTSRYCSIPMPVAP